MRAPAIAPAELTYGTLQEPSWCAAVQTFRRGGTAALSFLVGVPVPDAADD